MQPYVYSKERVYFAICLVISVLAYIALVISLIGIAYIVIGALVAMMIHGFLIGYLRGNAIRVTSRQFPDLYRITNDLAAKMEMQAPVVYVLQSGGVLNAFATRFLGRNFVVLFSDVLEVASRDGEAAVAFIVAHELAHIKRGHLRWRWALYPSMLVPFLGGAYSRACEYTCDSFGAFCRPEGAVPGLLVLAAGGQLYRQVDTHEYSRQVEIDGGFWTWLAEVLSTHPNLAKRVRAVVNRGASVPQAVAATAYAVS
jgi:Zn-dependent protease with chaperone function